jgi:dienelactone hydrolase
MTAVSVPAALAATSAADRCETGKLKAAAKACACRHSAAARALVKGIASDPSKCTIKLDDAFAKAEAKAPGQCPATGEVSTVATRLAALDDEVAAALETLSAGDRDSARCAAAKLKATGKKCSCMLNAQSRAARSGRAPDFAKCDAKLAAAFAKAEEKAGGICPTVGDAQGLCAVVDATFDEVEADIANLGTADFAAPGPFGVGVRTMTLVDTSRPTAANGTFPGAPERTLVVEVWYPIEPGGIIAQKPNAPFIEGSGPFPLLLRAHGFSGFRTDSGYLTHHLATHGYIVVAPDFPLSNLFAPGGPTLADVGEQALDLGFLIDSFTAANSEPSSPFFGHVDTETIGAIGHSLGGATVLLATFHPTLRDLRVDATVGLSPLACVLLDGFFDTTTTPLMIQGGTVDMITPYVSNQLVPFGFANASKYLVTLEGGTHLGFSNRLLFGPGDNGDDAIGCDFFVSPGDPRPVTIDPGLPPDFLGGAAAGLDPTGAACEPICPLPPPSFMLHARQNLLSKAASLALFDAKLRQSVAGGRMITGKLDSDNTDLELTFAE